MAQVTFFHYIHKDTILHKMDGRLKLLCMLLLTLSVSFITEWYHYILLVCVVGLALVVSKLPLITIFKEMKLFAIMIVIILAMSGWPFATRLVLMLMISTAMAGTTSLLTIKNAIEWYLRPIPFVPEVRIATIINLTFVLIPVIFDNYLEMMNAGKARCIKLRKNPIQRIKFIVFPLLTRTLRRADEIVYAMESRCYSEIRTRAIFKTNKMDWLILAGCIVVLVFVLL
jgi:energy-coupling factor transporter transmembrane protein EcfT